MNVVHAIQCQELHYQITFKEKSESKDIFKNDNEQAKYNNMKISKFKD